MGRGVNLKDQFTVVIGNRRGNGYPGDTSLEMTDYKIMTKVTNGGKFIADLSQIEKHKLPGYQKCELRADNPKEREMPWFNKVVWFYVEASSEADAYNQLMKAAQLTNQRCDVLSQPTLCSD